MNYSVLISTQFFLILSLSIHSFGQTIDQAKNNKSFQDYIQNNLTLQDSAKPKNEENKVVIKYVVNEDGSIGDIEIIKGLDAKRDSDAIRLFSRMLKPKPAKSNGKYVKAYFTQPIVFKNN